MSEEDTYLRAKLTEINVSIERLTDMLNRMIEVISSIGEVKESTADISARVSENSTKLDSILRKIESSPVSTSGGASSGMSIEDKGAISSSTAVLDNLEAQFREGAIASDLSEKISAAATSLEEKGVTGSIVVKMNRWVRILKTYGRIDSVSPSDLGKIRTDLREWQKEITARR
ncbi:MAG: hypothetical protein P1Q69_15250 [Candidatus Thorarchaeota archaeon]|nr:hypothetical protein [Candidatus Thorarchaeota archaeon]